MTKKIIKHQINNTYIKLGDLVSRHMNNKGKWSATFGKDYNWDLLKNDIKEQGLLNPLIVKYIKAKTNLPNLWKHKQHNKILKKNKAWVNKYYVYEGNHRLKMLKELYDEDYCVPVIFQDNVDEYGETREKYRKTLLFPKELEPKISFKELCINRIKKIIYFINFYIMKLYFGIILKLNLKLKEIPLYLIWTDVKFDLGDDAYDYDKLYRSLLRTNGLDLKNHTPPMVYPLLWDGEHDKTKKILEQKFKYKIKDGNHRLATLQFMNLSNKLATYKPEVMVKVLVASRDFYLALDRYELIDKSFYGDSVMMNDKGTLVEWKTRNGYKKENYVDKESFKNK